MWGMPKMRAQKLMRKGKTTGIWQIESKRMRELQSLERELKMGNEWF
jgi:DNA polymerase III alpha subunit